MKAEIINVTPQMATDWLSLNTENRALRRTVVEGLKSAFLRGEYVPTHQGIAFSQSGLLLDGQHRLTAISELRDGVFPMLVMRGVSEDAFRVMDIGVKRNAADALRLDDRRVVEVARLLAVIASPKRDAPTPTMLIPFINAIDGYHASLMGFCITIAKVWSSAPVRVAAIVSMIDGGNIDYIKTTYRSLVMSEFNSMPPVAQALYRAQVNGTVMARDRLDMIARCMVVFNHKKANLSKIQIISPSDATNRIRAMFASLIETEEEFGAVKKIATPEGAAKSVLRTNYKVGVR